MRDDKFFSIYSVRYKVQLHGIEGRALDFSLTGTAIKHCFFATLENWCDNKFYFLLDDGSMVIVPYTDVMFMAPAKEQEVKNG